MLRRTNFAFLSQSYEKSSEMQKEFLLFIPRITAAPSRDSKYAECIEVSLSTAKNLSQITKNERNEIEDLDRGAS